MDEEPSPISSSEPERAQPEASARSSRNGTLGSLLESTGRAFAPVARAGWHGARGVARRLGFDRAIERGVDSALDSETAARATERLLDNETSKRVWDTVLESDEAQKLVERVADAPEIREAIAKQGIGVVEDLRRGVRSAARRIDTASSGWPDACSAGRCGSAARSTPAPSAGCWRWHRCRRRLWLPTPDHGGDRVPDLDLPVGGSARRDLRARARLRRLVADRHHLSRDLLVRRRADARDVIRRHPDALRGRAARQAGPGIAARDLAADLGSAPCCSASGASSSTASAAAGPTAGHTRSSATPTRSSTRTSFSGRALLPAFP